MNHKSMICWNKLKCALIAVNVVNVQWTWVVSNLIYIVKSVVIIGDVVAAILRVRIRKNLRISNWLNWRKKRDKTWFWSKRMSKSLSTEYSFQLLKKLENCSSLPKWNTKKNGESTSHWNKIEHFLSFTFTHTHVKLTWRVRRKLKYSLRINNRKNSLFSHNLSLKNVNKSSKRLASSLLKRYLLSTKK